MPRFEGEDLDYEERKKVMADQKNSWLEQQVQERKAAQEERKKAEAAYMVTYPMSNMESTSRIFLYRMPIYCNLLHYFPINMVLSYLL